MPRVDFQEDGGSPVTNYIVEKQDVKTGKWEPVSKFVRNLNFEVMGLTEGHEYNFRVMAENEFGVSEPLETTLSVAAQYPYSELAFSHLHQDILTVDCNKPASPFLFPFVINRPSGEPLKNVILSSF